VIGYGVIVEREPGTGGVLESSGEGAGLVSPGGG
jgi:hypothetical protein